jgi:hypothetical protein
VNIRKRGDVDWVLYDNQTRCDKTDDRIEFKAWRRFNYVEDGFANSS